MKHTAYCGHAQTSLNATAVISQTLFFSESAAFPNAFQSFWAVYRAAGHWPCLTQAAYSAAQLNKTKCTWVHPQWEWSNSLANSIESDCMLFIAPAHMKDAFHSPADVSPWYGLLWQNNATCRRRSHTLKNVSLQKQDGNGLKEETVLIQTCSKS